MKAWGVLPGLDYHPPYPFWQVGMFSIRGPAADNVARGHRLGVSTVTWFFAPHIWADELRAAENRAKGLNRCDHCEGTGNELKSMYRKCPACEGRGHRSAAA